MIMRLILKLLAVPFALALTLVAALCSIALSVSGKVLGAVSGIVFILSVVLLATGQTAGGIAWMAVAFIVSPFGLPVFAEWLVGLLDSAGHMLRTFIFS